MGTKIFWLITAFFALCWFVAFAHFSDLFEILPNNWHEKIQYWDANGNFIYSGAHISTLSGATDFFAGAIAVNDIKTLHSEPNAPSKFYIEYPDFAEVQNLGILTKIRDKIVGLGIKDSSASGTIIGYDAHFSLTNGNHIGSVIYDIHRHSSEWKITESLNQIFLVTPSGEVFNPKDLADLSMTGSSSHFIGKITERFQSKFPNKKLIAGELIEQNLVAFLQDPQFAFSGSEVDFYINSGIFTEENKSPIILNIPYSEVENIILLAPKPKIVKNAEEKNTGKSSDGKKYVALTFDDGPHKTYTPQLLDTLKEKWVHATFFILGKNIAGKEAILERMKNEWNEISAHSWSHPSFTKISKQAIRTEMQKTDDAIRAAVGITPNLFRPPYGAYDQSVLKTTGKTVIMWSVDSLDWKNRNIQKNLKKTLSQVHDGAIILFHDIHKESVDTIPVLIDQLREQWYEFLTVSELYEKYYNNATFLPEQVCFSMKRC